MYFGAYEQDNNISNGKEEIEWLILDKQESKALLISKYALDCQPYNTSSTDTTWNTCTLRMWLNNNFLNSAFSAEEQPIILTSTISADKNPKYNTNPGVATHDKIFLLSNVEANKYFSSDENRNCEPTKYADANGSWTGIWWEDKKSNYSWWWLRSPGQTQKRATCVTERGIGLAGDVVATDYISIRPALWIDLDALD